MRAYAALGDSFTAGRDSIAAERWADLLAAGMRRVNPDLRYANLAVDGATSTEVLDHQVEPALELEPDFVSVICGANDVLLATRPDVSGYEERIDDDLRSAARGRPGGGHRHRHGAGELALHGDAAAHRTAPDQGDDRAQRGHSCRRGRYDILCLPIAGHEALRDPDTFSADGLHPSSGGHRFVAEQAAIVLHQHFGIEFEMEGEGEA